jgi:hypothetical protein
MELIMSLDVFQCDDELGNGCGRLFDDSIVRQVGKLCEFCAADLPEEGGC